MTTHTITDLIEAAKSGQHIGEYFYVGNDGPGYVMNDYGAGLKVSYNGRPAVIDIAYANGELEVSHDDGQADVVTADELD